MRFQQTFRWLFPALCWLVSGLVNNALAADRPNILFCIADDWSHNHAGVYGNTWVKTPSFDTIARRGVLFTRAYTPNAKCAPSRAIILTGRNSWQLEDACNHVCNFPPKFKSWIEALADHGYACGYTGKGWGPGIAKNAKGQHRLITGKAFTARKKNTGIRGISNNDYSSNFADFLKATPGDQPWCFWYGTTEPHRSYQYGVGVAKAGKQLSDIKHVPTFWPDNETVRNDMLDYAFEVEHYDTHLGRILKHLEAAGQLDNTLVVATSDHGMPFPRCKGQAYDYSNHVPLAIMWPGKLKKVGRVVDDYVSFADFAPTFLEVAGLATLRAGLQPTTGQSLMDILGSEKSGQVNS
ncbi:MAG: sulfatase, partial [Planctomycetaceae bacterium]|nr:sulfatase [Planctomycetaceae bacterium]